VPAEFSIDTQVHLVLGLLGLFNFIRKYDRVRLPDECDDTPGNQEPLPCTTSPQRQGTKAMKAFRDKIAKEMWKDYCDYTRRAYE
jgi:hypothetical protein